MVKGLTRVHGNVKQQVEEMMDFVSISCVLPVVGSCVLCRRMHSSAQHWVFLNMGPAGA